MAGGGKVKIIDQHCCEDGAVARVRNGRLLVDTGTSGGGPSADVNIASVGGTPVSSPLPVDVQQPVSVDDNGGSLTVDGTVAISGGSVTIQEPLTVDDGGGSITVDGEVEANLEVNGAPVTNANPVPVEVQGTVDITEPVSIDDNGGSITVDGTVAISGGTVTIQEPLTVDGEVEANLEVNGAPVTNANPVPVEVQGTVDITEPVTVDDGGGSITVDGTVAISGGTVTIQEPLSIDDNGGSITVDGEVEANLEVNGAPVTNANPVPVEVQGTVDITEPVTIEDGGGSITVDGTVAISGGTVTVQEPLSIDDNGGSITVDGTVAISGGTVSIQEPLSIDDGGGSITVDGTVSIQEPLTIDDGGGSITVDGTVAISGGTVTIQEPLTVDGAVDANLQVGNVDVDNANPVPVSVVQMVEAFTVHPLSESTGGRPVVVTVTTSGTAVDIHTVPASKIDCIQIFASVIGNDGVTINFEFDSGDTMQSYLHPAATNIALPEVILEAGETIEAYLSAAETVHLMAKIVRRDA